MCSWRGCSIRRWVTRQRDERLPKRSSVRRRFSGDISAASCDSDACPSWNSVSTNQSPTRTGSSRFCETCTRKRRSARRKRNEETMTSVAEDTLAKIAQAIHARPRCVIASHTRPDGDAIGSSLAMAFALRELGKEARVVSRDVPPSPMLVFPGVLGIEVTDRVDDPGDAVIVMECGDL